MHIRIHDRYNQVVINTVLVVINTVLVVINTVLVVVRV